jgi:hypothetical protein
MSTPTQATSALVGDRSTTGRAEAARDRSRRRAMRVTAVIAIASFALLVDLLLVRHTVGEEIWGPITAAMGALAAGLSLAALAVRTRNRAARIGLIALWLTIAFFGFGGYNSHRLALPEGTVDSRTRPPLAPLVFTGMGIAGALSLRSGTKGD